MPYMYKTFFIKVAILQILMITLSTLTIKCYHFDKMTKQIVKVNVFKQHLIFNTNKEISTLYFWLKHSSTPEHKGYKLISEWAVLAKGYFMQIVDN